MSSQWYETITIVGLVKVHTTIDHCLLTVVVFPILHNADSFHARSSYVLCLSLSSYPIKT